MREQRDRYRRHEDGSQQATEVLLKAANLVRRERHGVFNFYHAESCRVCSYSHSGGAKTSARAGDKIRIAMQESGF
jgi:hypothetical protein